MIILLTANEKKVFEKLLDDPEFKGKKLLQHLYWMNSSIPKFKIGDVVRFTSTGTKIYGKPLINVVGTISNILCPNGMNYYCYELDCNFEVPNNIYNTRDYICEDSLILETNSDGINHNWID